jgi:hypothetical protein
MMPKVDGIALTHPRTCPRSPALTSVARGFPFPKPWQSAGGLGPHCHRERVTPVAFPNFIQSTLNPKYSGTALQSASAVGQLVAPAAPNFTDILTYKGTALQPVDVAEITKQLYASLSSGTIGTQHHVEMLPKDTEERIAQLEAENKQLREYVVMFFQPAVQPTNLGVPGAWRRLGHCA